MRCFASFASLKTVQTVHTLDRFCHFHNLSFSLSLKIQRTNYTLISLSHHNCAVADTSFDLCKICNVSSSSFSNQGLVGSPLFPGILGIFRWWTKGSFSLCNICSGGRRGALPSAKSALLYIFWVFLFRRKVSWDLSSSLEYHEYHDREGQFNHH